jgi:hypothetical protein
MISGCFRIAEYGAQCKQKCRGKLQSTAITPAWRIRNSRVASIVFDGRVDLDTGSMTPYPVAR